MERYFELSDETPYSDEIENDYHIDDEHIQMILTRTEQNSII